MRNTLKKQLELTNQIDFLKFPYHQAIVNHEIPLSIGGGIGQSRTLMLLLRKAHLGRSQRHSVAEDAEGDVREEADLRPRLDTGHTQKRRLWPPLFVLFIASSHRQSPGCSLFASSFFRRNSRPKDG